MSCRSFIKLFIPVLIRSALAGWCGEIQPNLTTAPEGTTVDFRLTAKPTLPDYIHVQWRYEFPYKPNTILCDSKEEQCKEPTKYTQSKNGLLLTIKAVSQNDSGTYICRCYTDKYGNWSERGTLNVTKAKARQDQVHHKISTESANEYRTTPHSATTAVESKTVNTEGTPKPSADNVRKLHLTESTNKYLPTTHGSTAKDESGTLKTEVSDSATDYKVSSTLEDTGQVTTILVAGGVAVGTVLTVIVVIICKKEKKNDIHRTGQKAGLTQTNSEGAEGQDNSLPNESGKTHSRQLSERVSLFVQHEADHNPGALYDQQASSSAAEQFNSEYATVVPKKDRTSSIQQRDTNKIVVKDEESAQEYATVVKSRQPSCTVEQTTQRGKNKNEHGLVYVDLDFMSRPQREAASRAHEATEYVSIDFQKTTTLKSQQK